MSKIEMETLRSGFHAQLTSIMDTLLAAAVCEIAKIFESSLSEHQAELLQKTNEISILRSELDKVERRCTAIVLTVDIDEKPTSEIEQRVKQEPDPVHISQDKVTQCQNTAIKEEVKSDEAVQSNYEQCGLQPNLELASRQMPEIQLCINQHENLSSAQPKDKTADWCQSSHTAAQLHEEDAYSPPLSPPKVRSDTTRTEGWLPGLNPTQESAIENIQSSKRVWSIALNTQTAFDVDETVSEDNNATFVNRESENPIYNHDILHSGQREGGGLKNRIRQGSTFRSRDRPQSSFHTFALRSTDCHRPTGSVVIGRPYSCPYCAKCFAYPSHQRRHLQRHTGVRLHSCQFCDKRFLTPSELTVHTRTHTGERPFSCGQCGKRFARSGNLRAHQRDVHLGKRPFACTECGKKFSHKGNLRVHRHRVHQGPLQQQQSCIDSETV